VRPVAAPAGDEPLDRCHAHIVAYDPGVTGVGSSHAGWAEGMPDFHQPDEDDRAEAEAEHAEEEGLPDLGPEVDRLREERPSSEHDPNWPDRPKT
jgi:hypothetical protein